MELTESQEQQLSAADKARLCKLMLRIGLDGEFAPPGSFLRMHLNRLQRQLESARSRNERERELRAKRSSVTRTLSEEQQRIQAAASQAVAMVLEKGVSQAKAAKTVAISRSTLARALAKKKAQTAPTNQHE